MAKRGEIISVTKEVIERIEIDEYLESDFRALTNAEYQTLCESVDEHGFKDPITLWRRGRQRYTVVCGHHRLQLKRDEFPQRALKANVISFRNYDDALNYAHQEQAGRRNLNAWEQSYRRGQLYLGKKRPPGPQSPKLKTADALAEQFKVSAMTIKNDGAFAKGVNAIAEKFGVKAKTKLLSGEYTKASLDLIRSIGRGTTPISAFAEVMRGESRSGGKKTGKRKSVARMHGELADVLAEDLFILEGAELDNQSRLALERIKATVGKFVRTPVIKEKMESP